MLAGVLPSPPSGTFGCNIELFCNLHTFAAVLRQSSLSSADGNIVIDRRAFFQRDLRFAAIAAIALANELRQKGMLCTSDLCDILTVSPEFPGA